MSSACSRHRRRSALVAEASAPSLLLSPAPGFVTLLLLLPLALAVAALEAAPVGRLDS